MTPMPERTSKQRAEALDKALATRRERARLRAALKDRQLHPVEVIAGAADNPVWRSVKVLWLLEAVPGLGPIRAERLMDSLGIAQSRRLQGLGERQRAALIESLEARS